MTKSFLIWWYIPGSKLFNRFRLYSRSRIDANQILFSSPFIFNLIKIIKYSVFLGFLFCCYFAIYSTVKIFSSEILVYFFRIYNLTSAYNLRTDISANPANWNWYVLGQTRIKFVRIKLPQSHKQCVGSFLLVQCF